MYLILGYLKI